MASAGGKLCGAATAAQPDYLRGTAAVFEAVAVVFDWPDAAGTSASRALVPGHRDGTEASWDTKSANVRKVGKSEPLGRSSPKSDLAV